ncbi:tRNA glutamyl-Q(34) synthetase GluQRS [Methylobacterium sp. WSM2598]|uniref:tRNA glutamyl-Q(34) synthetase GluQRS n=1 Tax=Methylobacterium sp. WSM2598 TaxID=398261 RepID=UPI00036ED84A|nr:tRNA glutamyl-Q(34) synthetase GluQRS [Methylobacterium sp. WSM2598]
MSPPVFRFAPSPNGRLHLGHAYSALLNAALAARMRGRLILRIEDIDVTRCRPELAAATIEDLRWLGLPFEEPVRRQSAHFAEYAAALARLRARSLVYPCFCTRREVAGTSTGRDPDGAPLYPGTCRGRPDAAARIAAGEPHAWRLDMVRARAACPEPLLVASFDPEGAVTHREARPERWGDAVLARKDVPASYHLAVVHDDALQGVTHVVRGADLDAATDLHRLLQALLGLPAPLYHHHGLILDPEGGKLAKSRGSEPLASLRARGATPQGLRARLGLA